MSLVPGRVVLTAKLFLLALSVLPQVACKSDKPGNSSISAFATTDDAGKAVAEAAKSGDRDRLLAIFGPDAKDVIFSGDAVQDRNIANKFSTEYEVMHRWRRIADGSEVLVVGADNFPFPIPLKKNDQGQWFFDTAAGKEEILNRRVGRNELATIEACRSAADAQQQYFAQVHDGGRKRQYARKFISDPGKQNGLYWNSAEGQPESPLGPLAAFATSEGYNVKPDAHTPFNGYYFHMLLGQGSNALGGAKQYVKDGKMVGGFAFVAYPAQYGNSGVMTFIINQDGVLLEKDLGQATAETAAAMSEFDPDGGWTPVSR
jgi:hypothetical protein